MKYPALQKPLCCSVRAELGGYVTVVAAGGPHAGTKRPTWIGDRMVRYEPAHTSREDDLAYAAGWTISGLATLGTIIAVWMFAI